jgi:hypothetical protein
VTKYTYYHRFSPGPNGAVYTVHALLGSDLPVLGPLINLYIRKRYLTGEFVLHQRPISAGKQICVRVDFPSSELREMARSGIWNSMYLNFLLLYRTLF